MKKLFFSLLILAGLLTQACSQNVPVSVKEAFLNKFPKATKVKWSNEEALIYEAEFKLNGSEMSANFDEKGTWMETEVEITETQLPDAIKTTLMTDFKESKINEISTLEEPGKDLKYELAIKKNRESLDLVFAANGTLLDKKTEKENKK